MTDKARYDKGLAIRKEVVGKAYVEKALANADGFDSKLQDLVTEYCWGAVWGREGLDRKYRSVLALGIAIALNRGQEFKIHIKGALANGFSTDEISELLLQVAIYAGVPASIDAFRLAREAIAEYKTDHA